MSPKPCQRCKKLDHEINHPVGRVFVGWGHGWDTCSACNGTGVEVPTDSCSLCGLAHDPDEPHNIRWIKGVDGPRACIDQTSCRLRAELRDLRAAVLAIADRLREEGVGHGAMWIARDLREAVGKSS